MIFKTRPWVEESHTWPILNHVGLPLHFFASNQKILVQM